MLMFFPHDNPSKATNIDKIPYNLEGMEGRVMLDNKIGKFISDAASSLLNVAIV